MVLDTLRSKLTRYGVGRSSDVMNVQAASIAQEPVPMIRASATSGIDTLAADFTRCKSSILRPRSLIDIDDAVGSTRLQGDAMISLEQFSKCLDDGAQRSRDPEFGFVFGTRLDPRALGPNGYALVLSPTLGDALNTFCRNFASVQGGSRVRFETDGNIAHVTYTVDAARSLASNQDSARAQDAEMSLGLIVGLIRRARASETVAMDLSFEHAPLLPCALKEHMSRRSVSHLMPINMVAFSADLLSTPMPGHDPRLLALSIASAEAEARDAHVPDWLAQVRAVLLHEALTARPSSLAALAADHGCSPRALQANLKSCRTTFRAERRLAVMKCACQMLRKEGANVTDTALALGYSETSAFSRAFRSHFGFPPSHLSKVREASSPHVLTDRAAHQVKSVRQN